MTYRAPDGRRLRLPHSFIHDLVPVADGVVVADKPFEGSVELHLVRPAGVRDLGPCSSGEPRTSRDGTVLAWTSFACPESGQNGPSLLHRETPSGRGQTSITGRLPLVAGLVGDEVVFSNDSGTYRTDLVAPPRRVPGVTWADDVEPTRGLVLGRRDRGPSRVTDINTGASLWTARRAHLNYASRFSPDGSKVLSPGGRVRVFDSRTGELLHELELPSGLNLQGWECEWEDDRHVLVVVAEARSSAVLRVGFDGHAERTTAIVKLRGRGQVFVL